MPFEPYDHERTAALLTQLNRAGPPRRRRWQGLAVAMVIAAGGVTAATVLLTPHPTSPPAGAGAPLLPQAASGASSASRLETQAWATQARETVPAAAVRVPVTVAVVTPPPGPPLEPDVDGTLAIMPKAPANLARARPWRPGPSVIETAVE